MNIVPAINSEISTLEDALRSDPRFVKLTKLRELQLLYNGEEEEHDPAPRRARIAPPAAAPKKNGAGHPKPARAAKPSKPAKKPKVAATGPSTEQMDLVYAAMWALTQKKKHPTYALLIKKTKLSSIQIAAAINGLSKSGRITTHGERKQRTYEFHNDAITEQELEEHGGNIEPGEAKAAVEDADRDDGAEEEEFAEVEEAPPPCRSRAEPTPVRLRYRSVQALRSRSADGDAFGWRQRSRLPDRALCGHSRRSRARDSDDAQCGRDHLTHAWQVVSHRFRLRSRESRARG
jgi:hypothetical protein